MAAAVIRGVKLWGLCSPEVALAPKTWCNWLVGGKWPRHRKNMASPWGLAQTQVGPWWPWVHGPQCPNGFTHPCEACVALGAPPQAATLHLSQKISQIKCAKNPPQAQTSTATAPCHPMHATHPQLALPGCPQSWTHLLCKPQWPFY